MSNINREIYEEDLKRRQKQHLDSIIEYQNRDWQPCMHDGCTQCIGTGVRHDGSSCVHALSCPCPRCSPRC